MKKFWTAALIFALLLNLAAFFCLAEEIPSEEPGICGALSSEWESADAGTDFLIAENAMKTEASIPSEAAEAVSETEDSTASELAVIPSGTENETADLIPSEAADAADALAPAQTGEAIPAERYEIRYSLSGGTNHPDNPDSYTSLERVTFADPTRAGYTFAGWYSDAAFKKAITGIDKGSKGSKKVYAKWSVNHYRVEWNGNGAENIGSYEQKFVYNQSANLTACKFKRTGYAFAGWNTMPDGSGTAYKDKQAVKNLTEKDGEVLSLYACWKINTYTVSYSLGGGTNSPENPVKYTVEDRLTLIDPQRAGYVFQGWFTDANFKKPFAGFDGKTAKNIKLYAKWSANQFTVEYSGNGAANTQTYRQSFKCDKSTAMTACRYSRPGYTFAGWNTMPDGSGTAYKDKYLFKNASFDNGEVISLYACWKINSYTVSYSLGGGTNSPENPVKYTVEDRLTLRDPQRAGYVFRGWFTDVTLKTPFAGFDGKTAKNIKLYAKWSEKKFTFVFHGNGADNDGTYLQTDLCKSTAKLTPNRFTSRENVFFNWNTKPDGSGITVADGASFLSVPGEDGAIIDLYAQWGPRMTSLSFNGTDFRVVNTALDAVALSRLVENYICTSAGYPGYCLSFSYYYVSSMVNGITDITPQQGIHGISKGLRFETTESANAQTILSTLYDSLNTGLPQILMVKATNMRERHFLAVVGYKSSVEDRSSIQATDLLVIDSHDGKLESMDPEIFPDNTRLLHTQNGKYRMEVVKKSVKK